ncbi:hypothetical protein [Sphingomonas sp. MMS24-J13]|uniref:hypothetical protein n=1 Tax=Sphingomonas sp. MMS24-J13 TaxID=3238686 RepID=UPI00384C04E5
MSRPSDGPCQLWLDVARPIQTRPRVTPEQRERRAKSDFVASVGSQMELRMVAAPAVVAPAETPPPIRARPKTEYAAPLEAPRAPSFAAWLLNQTKQSGTLGELAKAAKLDRLFPRTGSADDVRARFSAAGADGDAFEALDDAERTFDRL